MRSASGSAAEESQRLWSLKRLPQVELIRASYRRKHFPKHTHDATVIGVNAAGVASFFARGARNVAPPSFIAFINAGEVHTGERVAGEVWEYRGMHVAPELLRSLAADVSGLAGIDPVFPSSLVEDRELAERFIRAHRECETPDDELDRESRLLSVLATLLVRYAEFPVDFRSEPPARRAVELAREMIEDNLGRKVTLDDLAEVSGLSKYHLLREFERETGLTPHRYLLDRRMRAACARLRAGSPPARVAEELGFADQSHFTRQFAQVVGVPPGRYAEALRR